MKRWDMDESPKDECGVLGVYAPGQEAARTAFFGLFALQHRGQESAGIAVSNGVKIRMKRGMGLVNTVFTEKGLKAMPGGLAVGHTRYSTTGSSKLRNAQPIMCQALVGDVAVAHNGNLVNALELRTELEKLGEVFDTTSDSEILARIFSRNLSKGPEEAVREVMRHCVGAYSVTVLTPKMLVGFRDPNGIRPLVAGTLGSGFFIASETCAFGPVGAEPVRELEPGEMVIVDESGMRFARGAESGRKAMCLFEFIYFARPDSNMYGTSLYSARERMGEQLSIEHPCEADLVVPVPDSGIPAALGYSRQSGIPFHEGMMKSRYIHRTFIQPSQQQRELGVRMKLTPLVENIKGKRLVLVDDSIVRGTTTKQIVKMLFDAGALEVHVRITAPPILNPCYYGIDMAKKTELAAAIMTLDELRDSLKATSLGYLSIPGAAKAVGRPMNEFCLACFNGDYPIPVNHEAVKEVFDEPAEEAPREPAMASAPVQASLYDPVA